MSKVNIEAKGNVKVGGDVVGRDKITNIIQQAQAYTPGALHQLRAVTAAFTGRADELDALVRQLRAGGRAAISGVGGVEGMGGIGKTELANLAGHALAPDFRDAQLFVELGAHSPAPLSTAQALSHCLRAFYPDAKLPDAERALGDLYRDALNGKRALVLLDDARDDAQVLALLPPAGCSAIVTTRRRLEGVPQLSLPTLPRADAIKLLLTVAPRLAAPSPALPRAAGEGESALDQLAAACGDLPIALGVAGGLLNARKSLRVQDYLRDLRERGLDALSSPSRQQNVQEVFAYSYRELTPAQQAAWRALAVMPSDFDRAAGVAVMGQGGARKGAKAQSTQQKILAALRLGERQLDRAPDATNAADNMLDELVALNLLEYDAARERFRWQDLLQQFARSPRLVGEGQGGEGERQAAERRHAQHYVAVIVRAQELYLKGGDDTMRALSLFDGEWAHIPAGQAWAARHADVDDDAARLCSWYAGPWSVLNLRLRPRDYIGWLEAALSAARRLKHREAEGVHLGNLGIEYKNLGNARQAIECYQQALVIEREVGDRRGEGNALGSLGNAYAALGDARQAIEFYEQRLVIAREIGDKRGEANALMNTGNAHFSLGELQEAIPYHEQALIIFRAIRDRRGEGNALGNLGSAYYALSDAHQAIAYYEQALVIRRVIGDRRGEGNDLWNKALALYALGERAQAIAHAEAALEIYEAIEDPYVEMVRKGLTEWRKAFTPNPSPVTRERGMPASRKTENRKKRKEKK